MYLHKEAEIWLSSMTKAPVQPENSKQQNDNTNTRQKIFEYM